jgi:hypothetical protein
MKGFVDDHLQALVHVPVSASKDGERKQIVAWIDTAFSVCLRTRRQPPYDPEADGGEYGDCGF